jgi:hypothetical protein
MMKDPIAEFMNGLSDKQKKFTKNTVQVIFLILIISAIPMAYNNGVTDGKVRYCHDQGLRLVSFHGIEQCMSLEEIEHQRSLVSSQKINNDVFNDFIGGEDVLQLNTTN